MNNGYKGYLEDRRPNSQGDPYQIASQILKTISEVPTGAKAALPDDPEAARVGAARASLMTRRSIAAPAGHCFMTCRH